jgi:hypothetical protein
MEYAIAIDFGYHKNLYLVLYNVKEKRFVQTYSCDLVGRSSVRTMKRKKQFINEIVGKITSVCRRMLMDTIDAETITILPERQLSYDLILLQGLVTGVLTSFFARYDPDVKMLRNMDACRHFNIPVAKKDISTEEKKARTMLKVRQLTGIVDVNEHEADAMLLVLYYYK